MCFADDLLIFVEGNISSVNQVLSILQDFKDKYGLAISIQKTCFFSSSLSPTETFQISTTIDFTHATLPVRYLGVLLCTKKLNLANCQTLIQRIKGRLSTWTTKSLSFASRRQLISSVISGITHFWTTSFVLPKKCIELINSLCSEFLWNGTAAVRNSTRVAWNSITMSKEEGVLGIGTCIIGIEHVLLSLSGFFSFGKILFGLTGI